MKSACSFKTIKAATAGLLGLLAVNAYAQIGSGWSSITETFKIQTSGSATVNGNTFSITKTTSGTKDRGEREYNTWSSGTHQFQGDCTVVSFGGNGICVKQTFQKDSGPWNMLALKNSGVIYEVSTGKSLGSFTVGTSFRVNTILDCGAGTVKVYLNGSLVETLTGGKNPIYDKCGTYRIDSGTAPITATWTNVQFWQGGSSSGGGTPQAAAPAFSPAAGTYTSAQNVAITSSTGGASIRYTTDGVTTPTETTGTIYSGPVNISSTTTLKAIAYEAGFTDSPVTSGTYTITAAPPPTLNFEAESISPVGTGATVSTSADANASGGVVEFLNSTAAGQVMTFTTPSIPAGTYQFQLRYWSNKTRGQHTVKIDGTQVGGTIDQYASAKAYVTVTLGNVTFASAGTHSIAMTVTGKQSAATQFYLTADKFTFVGQ